MPQNSLMRRKITAALTEYFGVDDSDGSYFYELERDKTDELSLDDFQEFTHIDIEDIVDEVMDAINKREQNDTQKTQKVAETPQAVENPAKTSQSKISELNHIAAIPLRDGAGI